MRWTPEKIAEFRELAPTGCGGAVIAKRFGINVHALDEKAHVLGISIARKGNPQPRPLEPDEYVRARWSKLIGSMKEQLRVDIGSL